jgi:hypothetical protein
MDKPFGFGGEVGYVGQNIHRGILLTTGPCIQPDLWVSFKDFSFGMFINMFGSTKDRKMEGGRIKRPMTGPGSQSFGMINQVKLYLDWEHSFGERFNLNAAYTHLAYGEHKDLEGYFKAYKWFNKNSTSGELSLIPSFKIGNFSLFTEQNLVIFGLEHDSTTYTKSEFGNYHSAYGVKYEKQLTDNFAFGGELSEHLASKGYFSNAVRFNDPSEGFVQIDSWGLYLTHIELMAAYMPVSWFSLALNCGVNYITNTTIAESVSVPIAPDEFSSEAVRIFGGLHAKFSW